MPTSLPQWMIDEDIIPGAKILGASHIATSGSKTDVLIRLDSRDDTTFYVGKGLGSRLNDHKADTSEKG